MYPANTRHLSGDDLLMAQYRRQWPLLNHNQINVSCLVAWVIQMLN